MLNNIYIPPKEIELIKDEARELLQAIKEQGSIQPFESNNGILQPVA